MRWGWGALAVATVAPVVVLPAAIWLIAPLSLAAQLHDAKTIALFAAVAMWLWWGLGLPVVTSLTGLVDVGAQHSVNFLALWLLAVTVVSFVLIGVGAVAG